VHRAHSVIAKKAAKKKYTSKNRFKLIRFLQLKVGEKSERERKSKIEIERENEGGKKRRK
jgi:hypothetical protein